MTHNLWVISFTISKLSKEESRFDLEASSDQLRMGDKVYSFDDHDCFECFQFKCDANSCPHHIGTGFGARESKLKNLIVGVVICVGRFAKSGKSLYSLESCLSRIIWFFYLHWLLNFEHVIK